MVPYVESEQQAREAAAAIRYPPHGGVRGVAKTTRATNFGRDFVEYWEHAVQRLLLVAQVRLTLRVVACRARALPRSCSSSRLRQARESRLRRPSPASTASTSSTLGPRICPSLSAAGRRCPLTTPALLLPASASLRLVGPRGSRQVSSAPCQSTCLLSGGKASPSSPSARMSAYWPRGFETALLLWRGQRSLALPRAGALSTRNKHRA
jgi:hypothetical protein